MDHNFERVSQNPVDRKIFHDAIEKATEGIAKFDEEKKNSP
jgi:hypothetical protein